MEVYLNEEKLNKISSEYNIKEIINKVRDRLEDKIIDKIYLNDKEVNEEFLLDVTRNIEQSSIIKFETKEVSKLIKESLEEAEKYLPKLKLGLLDVAELFRQGKIEKGTSKYNLCLEGIEWYTGILNKLLTLKKEEKLFKQTQELTNKLNNILLETMKAFQNQDMIFVADLLEYEITEFIDQFIEINSKLYKSVLE